MNFVYLKTRIALVLIVNVLIFSTSMVAAFFFSKINHSNFYVTDDGMHLTMYTKFYKEDFVPAVMYDLFLIWLPGTRRVH